MRIFRALMNAASVAKQIDFYSRFSPSPLSMKQFIDFGKLWIRCTRFNIRTELNRKDSTVTLYNISCSLVVQ